MSKRDTCANCGKGYDKHVESTQCYVGSGGKWFPKKLAEAITQQQKEIEEGVTKIKHHGLSRNRLSREPLEKKFADAWEERAPGTLGYLLCGQNRDFHDYTPRDAEVAATIIQWLGSPIGSSFVREILEEKEC